MFCEQCGFRLDDDARFCPQCGTAVMNDQTAPAPQFGMEEMPQTAPASQPDVKEMPEADSDFQSQQEILLTKVFKTEYNDLDVFFEEVNSWLRENAIEIRDVRLNSKLNKVFFNRVAGIRQLTITYVEEPDTELRYQLGTVQYFSTERHSDKTTELLDGWKMTHPNYEVVYSEKCHYEDMGNVDAIFFLFVGKGAEMKQKKTATVIEKKSGKIALAISTAEILVACAVPLVIAWFYLMIV